MRAMLALFAVMAAVLVAKDTFGLPMPNLFRGIAQVGCGLAGLLILVAHLPRGMFRLYWPAFGYIVCVMISAFFSSTPLYVFLQGASLAAVLVFAIALASQSASNYDATVQFTAKTAMVLYLVVCLGSLIALYTWPGRVYETVTAYKRFRGLFAEPGMMANASGLLLGISLFTIGWRWVRYCGVVAGAVCLGLAMSRTNWIAAAMAIAVTSWFFVPQYRRWLVGASVLALLGAITVSGFEIAIDEQKLERIVRKESLSTLSGRTVLWQASLRAAERSPVFGNGFTTGIDALIETSRRREGRYLEHIADLQGRHGTVHAGYLQALLDVGILGFAFYIAIIGLALWRLWKQGREAVWAPVFFVAMYGAVANGGKNFIYATAVFDSVMYWVMAMLALGLTLGRRTSAETERPSQRTAVFPHLLGSPSVNDPPRVQQ